MIFRQFLHADPIAASYLFGCGGRGVCAVVDPIEDIDFYVHAASETRMRIQYVIDTHVHADHVSGGRRLAAAAGTEYVLHASAATGQTLAVTDRQQLELGNVIIEVLHTPGHTPEHISLLVSDRARGAEPWMALTGHTLMVGDMGRTELASRADHGADMLFESARRLRELPDHVEVWPGALAGSVCGRRLSGKAASTIGFERRFNRAFATADRDAFVQLMLADIPPRPADAEENRAANLTAIRCVHAVRR